VKRKDLAFDSLEFLRNKTDSCLLIDGESLSLFLEHYSDLFISLAVQLPTVVACRCTPTQKADIARLIRQHTNKRICCIGDGGNDVSMIQAADVGVGIVGKEGRQASLAADFSVTQFCHLTKLLVWHGRNSYKRSAKLAQFVMHRGLVISVCQTVFSIASEFEPIALYQVIPSFLSFLECLVRITNFRVMVLTGMASCRIRNALHHVSCLLPCPRPRRR
jgi:phospholipid-translocating ATPase